MLLAVDALAHVHLLCASFPAVDWRVPCYAASCSVGICVRVLRVCQYVRREEARLGSFILCSPVCPGCTAIATSACLLSLAALPMHWPKHASKRTSREGALRVRVSLTPNFLKPLILSSWSRISTSSCAEASAVEGSDPRPLLLRAMLPVWAVRRVWVV